MQSALEEYLRKKMEERQRGETAEGQALGMAPSRTLARSDLQAGLGDALARASALAGSVGGKTPEAATMGADVQRANTRMAGALADADVARDKRYGMDTKVYEYLAKSKEKPAEKTPDERAQEYQDASGKTRIGRFITGRGLVTDPNDPMAPKKASAAGGVTPYQSWSMERAKQQDIARGEEKGEKQIQSLSKDIKPLQEITSSIRQVEDRLGFSLDDFDEKTGRRTDKDAEIDLPGVSIPGYGRVSAYSSDARVLDAAMAQVFNRELAERSGAAVTNPEMNRLLTEFAAGKFNTESEMLGAMKRYKTIVLAEIQNRQAAYTKDAVAKYRERGGETLETMSGYKPKDIPVDGEATAAATPGGAQTYQDGETRMIKGKDGVPRKHVRQGGGWRRVGE